MTTGQEGGVGERGGGRGGKKEFGGYEAGAHKFLFISILFQNVQSGCNMICSASAKPYRSCPGTPYFKLF